MDCSSIIGRIAIPWGAVFRWHINSSQSFCIVKWTLLMKVADALFFLLIQLFAGRVWNLLVIVSGEVLNKHSIALSLLLSLQMRHFWNISNSLWDKQLSSIVVSSLESASEI